MGPSFSDKILIIVNTAYTECASFRGNGDLDLNTDLHCDYTYTDRVNIPRNTGENQWKIYKLTSGAGWGGTSAANDLMFQYGLNDDAGEQWLRHDDTGNDDLDFTGFHLCSIEDSNLIPLISSNLEYYQGMLMSTNGYYQDLNSSNIDFNSNIKMNSSLPIVNLTNEMKDKKAYGVISDIEFDGNKRVYNTGKWYYTFKKEDGNRIRLNSVGEGGILITNYEKHNKEYDVIDNGDYLCSSPITGIAMKQDDDLLHNYTVAKITCSVDFINSNSPFHYTKFKHRYETYNGKEYPVVFVGCSYHCG